MEERQEEIIVHEREVSCDGGSGALGHPKVYLEIKAETNETCCPYCGQKFTYRSE